MSDWIFSSLSSRYDNNGICSNIEGGKDGRIPLSRKGPFPGPGDGNTTTESSSGSSDTDHDERIKGKPTSTNDSKGLSSKVDPMELEETDYPATSNDGVGNSERMSNAEAGPGPSTQTNRRKRQRERSDTEEQLGMSRNGNLRFFSNFCLFDYWIP